MNEIRATYWGKLSRDEQGHICNWHSVFNHSLDVALVLQEVLQNTVIGTRLAVLLGKRELDRIEIARLCAFAMLHDAGKVNSGFQVQAYEQVHRSVGHVKPMIEVLQDGNLQERVLIPLKANLMVEWFDEDSSIIDMLTATWCHHGRPVQPSYNMNPSIWSPDHGLDPIKGLEKLGTLLHTVFLDAFEYHPPFSGSGLTHFHHLFNGVLTLCDWIGSDTRFFPLEQEDYRSIEIPRMRARNALSALGLDASAYRNALTERTIGFHLISPFEPYDLQIKCASLPKSTEAGSLMIMESETGSGKTEAALMRFFALYQKGHVDGLYFALPTRAAATQLHQRVVEIVKRAFPTPETRPAVIQGVSGYIKVDEVQGIALPNFEVTWPDDIRDHMAERAWAGEHPKRYLAGTITVGTIDQVLLAGLQVRHAHMRAGALSKNLLVVDEVHASDLYMTRLLQSILNFHLSGGGHAVLMSATLGSVARERFLNGRDAPIPDLERAVRADYPVISESDRDSGSVTRIPVLSTTRGKRVKIKPVPIANAPVQIAAHALDAAARGAKVLIIRNLVKDCIQTLKAIEATGASSKHLFHVRGVVCPHHSRFSPTDRQLLDHAIEQGFGKHSPAKPLIAVATQTVEQSLDIDADLLITDLSPIDVLLQRIGRLHRHSKNRPEGFEKPSCLILVPEERDIRTFMDDQGSGRRGPHGLGTVYEDLRVLEAAWRLAEPRPEWTIPSDNRWLVEHGTHSQVLKAICQEDEAWNRHWAYLAGQEFAELQIADLSILDFDTPFADLTFNELNERLRTRLGRDDLSIAFEPPFKGPFGNPVSSLKLRLPAQSDVPESLTLGEEHVEVSDGEARFELAGATHRYSRYGLERI